MKKLILVLFYFSGVCFCQNLSDAKWISADSTFNNETILKLGYADNGELFIATYNGLYSKLDGETYTDYPSISINNFQLLNHDMAFTNNGNIYSSSDNGISWKANTVSYFSGAMYMDNSGYIYISRYDVASERESRPPAAYNIWVSADNGNSYNEYFTSGQIYSVYNLGPFYNGDIYFYGKLVYSPYSELTSGTFRTVNNQTGKKIADYNGNRFIDPKGNLYISTSSALEKFVADTLYKRDISIQNVNHILFYKNKLFLATNSGFYYTLNGDTNFIKLNTGLVNINCNYLLLDKDNHLLIATNKGYYKSNFTADEITGINDKKFISQYNFDLENNYPNPFNPSTIIKYKVENAGNVTLEVFNLLGQKILTLVNEFKTPGSYEVTFKANNLAAGMYIYTLRSGNYISSKKMMLVK